MRPGPDAFVSLLVGGGGVVKCSPYRGTHEKSRLRRRLNERFNLVHKHKGHISVASEPGRTVFQVRLPTHG